MHKKKKGRPKAAQKSHAQNHTSSGQLHGWHDLGESVKPSRLNRQAKRAWKRGQK